MCLGRALLLLIRFHATTVEGAMTRRRIGQEDLIARIGQEELVERPEARSAPALMALAALLDWTVALVARRGAARTIVVRGSAPWIGRMIGLGVSAGSSLSGRVCPAVG